MATIRTVFVVAAPTSVVWDVFKDIGAVHTRLAPGFVTDTTVDGDMRQVTFANGISVTERIVSVDDELHRLAYRIESGPASHHSASFEVMADGNNTRVVWTTDVLPDSAAERFKQMMNAGAEIMARALAQAKKCRPTAQSSSELGCASHQPC